MIAPTHSHTQPSASDLFTDREDARDLFKTALDTSQATDAYRMLVWYGVGGQGKTALQGAFGRLLDRRNEDARRLGAPRIGHALVDFHLDTERDIVQALLSMRLQMARTSGFSFFPSFDVAFARYFALTQPGKDIKASHPKLFDTGSSVLDDVLQAAVSAADKTIPGFSLFSKYGTKLAGKAGNALWDWWNRRGARVLYGIDELSLDQLRRKLPSYFGADLCDALDREKVGRFVIRLDTYEALWNGRSLKDGTGALLFDDWVRLLVQESPGVLFAITGRDKLRWSEIDSDWEQLLDQHLLGGLSRPDAEHFLTKCGIEAADIRKAMIEGAAGDETGDDGTSTETCLPYYLDLQVETFRNISAKRGPAASDFGGSRPEVLARFLNHTDRETVVLLQLASYPAQLETEVLDLLAKDFLNRGEAATDWSLIFNRSFVTKALGTTHVLHDLMREALQAQEKKDRPALYGRIHRALYEWFAARCRFEKSTSISSEEERAFLAAARHLAAFDPAQAVRWTNDRMQKLSDLARWRSLEAACVFALPLATETFGTEDQWTTAILLWLATVYHDTGRYPEAEALFERVRAIEEKTLGPEHPSTATTLHNLAQVYSDTGRYPEAEALYERVRATQEKTLGPEHPSTATTLHNLAQVYRDTGRYAEAEALYERVRAIQEKTLGPEHPSTATTLANLAQVYRDTGRYPEAEALYERVRATQEKTLGPEHPSTARTLHNLAQVYRDTGRYDEAEALFERVRAIYEKTLGPEHPSTATTLANLAGVYSDTGRYAEAEALYEQAIAIYKKSLGPNHSFIAAVSTDLARLYRQTGRYAEAATALVLARGILDAALPPHHPRMGRLWLELGLLAEATGKGQGACADLLKAEAIYAAAGCRAEFRRLKEAREALARLGCKIA